MEAGDDFDGPDATMAPQDGAGASVGALLRARRLELGMTHADVAHAVKLPPRRIVAMEEERWDELPDGPYLRGFLRNVARVLQLDAAALLERIDGSTMRMRPPESILAARDNTHATLPRRSGPVDDRHGGRKLVFGAFVFAIVAAVIAWSGTESFDRALTSGRALVAAGRSDAPPPGPATTTVAEAVAPPATGDGNAAAAAAADATTPNLPAMPPTDAAAGPGPNVTAPGSTNVATNPATTSPTNASSDVALVFHFNEDAWVEVKSADGRVLLHRLNVAGSDQKVEGGEAPFSLIVGNAKGVALRFRGQPVDLGPYTRDQVARLTLS
jgi:cytoskeleton protein RodZ